MIQLQFLAHVDEQRCTGCKHCEPICPSGAIEMVGKKAMINGDRCIDCQRCIDRCKVENAINRLPRPSEVVRYVDHLDVDQLQLKTLCQKAGILPEMPICGCTRTTGREAIAAILKGAKTPEDICAMTGLRAGCGMYCITRIFQVLDACGIALDEPPDRRWIKLTLSLGDLKEDTVARIDETYPQCFVGDDWKRLKRRHKPSVRKEDTHV
jgi:NAD-dependent dihydropyrimidine dehydrogenase PreA subunit/bacterioferritin-associated ferredoxin